MSQAATAEAAPRTIHLPGRHRGQRKIARSRARFIVANCGRRWGKSLYAILRQSDLALQGKRCWWIAPTYKLARGAWRSFRQIAEQLPDLMTIHDGAKRIETQAGGFIEVHSSHKPDGLRAVGLDDATFDEYAYGKDGVWSKVIRPALTDRKGSALFISTPFGKNHFFRLYTRALAEMEAHGEESTWAAFHFPSWDNPYLQRQEIEDARQDMTEREFRQEYEAIFLDDGGEVFRNIRACATLEEMDGPEDGHSYVFGVDWGRANDYTVISVMDQTDGKLVAKDRFNKIDYVLQKMRLTALYERFRPITILAEQNSMGSPLIDDLAAAGLPVEPFVTTNASKKLIVDQLALAFERQEIHILKDPSLVAELEAFDQKKLPGGLYRYSAPEGCHDDQVMSLAFAWHCARGAVNEHSGFLGWVRTQNALAEKEAAEAKLLALGGIPLDTTPEN